MCLTTNKMKHLTGKINYWQEYKYRLSFIYYLSYTHTNIFTYTRNNFKSSDNIKDATIIPLSSMAPSTPCNKLPCLEEYLEEEYESTSMTTGDGSKSNESRI